MSVEQLIEADLTWIDDRFESDVQIAVDAAGRIAAVGTHLGSPTRRLERTAILPGFVNAHSHAFQRGLRGKGEQFPAGAGTFWTWREAMYSLVESLDTELCYRLTLQAFREMRSAGITTVGEFHYVHHGTDETDFLLDQCIVEAARAAGIRLVLLQAYYRTGGIGTPLAGGQRRFDGVSLSTYWRQFNQLAQQLDPSRETLGVVAHSVRAVDIGEIERLYAEARQRQLPFHLHVEEQRQEIKECVTAYGLPPLRLLLERAGVGEHATAVHCTHSTDSDLADWLGDGGQVCLCPLTEANLGDGVPSLTEPLTTPLPFCLGSDSNARISMFEEMRWAEYAQRLRHERRGVVRDASGRSAERLLQAATLAGARSLSVPAGELHTGTWADLVAIDLEHDELLETTVEELPAALVFGSSSAVIRDSAVGGSWLNE